MMNKHLDSSSDVFPVYKKNHHGNERKVGFEIEYAGITIEKSIQLLQDLFSGDIVRLNKNEYVLKNSCLGQFKVELDAHLLKEMAAQSEQNKNENKIDIQGPIEHIISSTLKGVVPLEIVTPPVAIESIETLDHLIDTLQQHNVKGTNSSKVAGFGVHINPDVPSLSVNSILMYLKAYILLSDWLRQDINIDSTRDLLPFINEYPRAYKKKVLNPDYTPSIDKLIDDYIYYNPTRNRAFDMLPLFSYIDEARVLQKVNSKLIKPRPTYHYRLANSNLSVSSWRLTTEWKRWLIIEKLAANPELLGELAEKYLALEKKSIFFHTDQWIKIIINHLEKL